ncbi:MAG: STAS domain-containing protein [Gammaproteobacteria bacterium]|nr:STAS domain-containing protein [Gammaproteobacteria bacterium]MCW8986948.1 STAS domain-containing protein [Gammaproteobacteria bacterium]MCW9030311.1 STAS domain-containing protein [Gammaproteobacteria bacterium]
MQPTITKQSQGTYAIEGELNMQTVPGVSLQLQQILPGTEGETFTLDLALVTRSDSAGVALLVEVMQLAKVTKQTLLFSNLPRQMQDIADVSGLLDILPLSKS